MREKRANFSFFLMSVSERCFLGKGGEGGFFLVVMPALKVVGSMLETGFEPQQLLFFSFLLYPCHIGYARFFYRHKRNQENGRIPILSLLLLLPPCLEGGGGGKTGVKYSRMNIMQQNGKPLLKRFFLLQNNLSAHCTTSFKANEEKKLFNARVYGKVPSFNYRERKEWEMVFSTLGVYPVLSLPRLHGLIGRERK